MYIAVIPVSELIRPSLCPTNSSRHVPDASLVITKNLSEVAGVSCYLLSSDIKGCHLSTCMHQVPFEMRCCIWQHLQGAGRYGVGPKGNLQPFGTVAGDRHFRWHWVPVIVDWVRTGCISTVHGALGLCLTSDTAPWGTGHLMGAVSCHPAQCSSLECPGTHQIWHSYLCSTTSSPGADG